MGLRYLAGALEAFQRIYENSKKAVMAVCGEEWEQDCLKLVEDALRTALHVLVLELKPQLFAPRLLVLPVMDMLNVFTSEIMVCERLSTDLSTLFRGWIEYEQGELISQVDVDLESEEWTTVDELELHQLAPELMKFIRERYEMDYSTRLSQIISGEALTKVE
jgi:hypothetical protein